MEKTYEITGMKCQGCVKTVTEKLSAVRGVEKVVVDLDKKQATVTGNPFKLSLKRALKGTKFTLGKEIYKKIKKKKKTDSVLFFFAIKTKN